MVGEARVGGEGKGAPKGAPKGAMVAAWRPPRLDARRRGCREEAEQEQKLWEGVGEGAHPELVAFCLYTGSGVQITRGRWNR